MDAHGSVYAGTDATQTTPLNQGHATEAAHKREERALTYFLTFQGMLLCAAEAAGVLALVQRPVDAIGNDAEPIGVDLPVEQLRLGFDQFLADAPPVLDLDVAFKQFGTVHLSRANDRRCVALSWRGQYLSALADARIVTGVNTPDWEGFLPVSAAELEMLRQILANDWIIRSSGALVRASNVSLHNWYNLWIGELKLDLRDQLPFDATHWPFRLTVLLDGWRIEQLCLYRPLVYFTVFKSPTVLSQYYMSVRSLLELGQYRGQILTLTERSHDEIAAKLPSMAPGQLQCHNIVPSDIVGFITARYKILDIPWAAQFQPIMFMDSDIIFDTAIEPMLCAVARSDYLTAPLEPFSPMRTTPAVGSGLLQIEGHTPGFAVGFNCGTLGIPNIPTHAATLRLIRTIIVTHAAVHGRTAFPWVDQEVANYVSFRLASFGPAIQPFVRYGGWPDTEPSTEGRVGLVHFWPALDALAKLTAMQSYRRRIDAVVTASVSG